MDTIPVPHFDTLVFERRERALWMTLNRPKSLNAVNHQMHEDLTNGLAWAARDDGSDVIVITGAGRGFCSGGDIGGMQTGGNTAIGPTDVYTPGRRLIDTLLWIEKPMVAMVNGPAAGLGATLALFCDIVIMAEDATIGDRHVNFGLVAGDGGAVIWPMLIGPARAKELLMTGRMVGGLEAVRMGLVSRAVPLADIAKEATRVAEELCRLPKFAVRATKMSVNRLMRQQAEHVIDASLAWERISIAGPEHKAAVAAQIKKRNI